MGLIRLKKSIFFSLISVSLSGMSYGSQDEKSSKNHNNIEEKPLFSPLIAGSWRSKCLMDEQTGLGMRIFWNTNLVSEGKFKLRQDYNLYDDRMCRSKVVQISTESQLTTRKMNDKFFFFKGKQSNLKLSNFYINQDMRVGNLKLLLEFVKLCESPNNNLSTLMDSPFIKALLLNYQMIFGADLEINFGNENNYIVVKDDDETERTNHRLFFVPPSLLVDSNVYFGHNFLENIYEQALKAKENTYDNFYASVLSVLFINNANVALVIAREHLVKTIGTISPIIMRYFKPKRD